MRIAVLICQVLTSAGHICHSFQTAKDVLAQLRKDSYRHADPRLAGGRPGGAEVLRRAKEKMAPNTPTMFLATSSGEDDIVPAWAPAPTTT
jgi:DNA-binding response OmpR family regulator